MADINMERVGEHHPPHISTHIPQTDLAQAATFLSLSEPHQLRAVEITRQVASLSSWDRLRVMIIAGGDYLSWSESTYDPPRWSRIVTAVIELLDFPAIEDVADALLYRMCDQAGWKLQVNRWAYEAGHGRLFDLIDAGCAAAINFASGDDERKPHGVH